ncbi:MAG: hypothetical protein AB7U75_22585 [Hyphomicrobiaceae bacterium]
MSRRHTPIKGLIEVRVTTVSQLFNSLDPSPFRSRDLDVDAEAHIIDWARELPRDAALELKIYLPKDEAEAASRGGIAEALAHYFTERANAAGRDLAEHFRAAWHYLTIGLPVLALCLLASHAAATLLGDGTLSRILRESLIIIGWVANWKWIEAVLYDWWPIKRRRDLYRRLAMARVEIIPG